MPQDGTFDHEAAENQFFAAQTIQNACGTQALLSVLLNKADLIDIGPKLQEFREFTGALPADVGSSYSLTYDELSFIATRRSAFEFGANQRCSQFLCTSLAICR